MKDWILGFAILAALALAFAVGRSYGLKHAPEYVEMKERERAELLAEMEAIEAEYANSPDATCEKIFDLVIEDLTYRAHPPEGR